MTTSDWLVFGGIAVPTVLTLIGSWVALNRRIDRKLSREEHEKICAERNDRVERKFDDLRDDLKEQRRETRETLSEIRNSITGTHKRLDLFLQQDRGGR